MDRFSEKQASINQRRTQALGLYPALWSNIITKWKLPDASDRVWLTYSANYLFRTNNIRWAMDPLTLNWRIKDAPSVNVTRDLGGLSFVLLTHSHADHLDFDLLTALRRAPITWVIPEFLRARVIEKAELPRQNILTPIPNESIELNGIHILPFEGLHWERAPEGDFKGVPAMGYLIECNGKRWLFPGDTRTYDIAQLPSFNSVDVLFAHLWLGRGCASVDEPPLLDAFCRFTRDLNPRRLVLTHLHEFGRDANDWWDGTHVQTIRSKFQRMPVDFSVSSLFMGENTLL